MKDKIQNLTRLGEGLKNSGEFQLATEKAESKNPWFTKEFIATALNAITDEMLTEAKLKEWLSKYKLRTVNKTVGLIFAGNIPLVGFHDFLCCYVTGCKMKVKLSSKDDELFPALLNVLYTIDKELQGKIEFVDRLKDFDAVIATGSDNTNRYFEYYFRDYPRILRRNRNSVGVLTGTESQDQLEKLGDDIFMYFGFGCRNVSKLYVPQGYDITQLFPRFSKYAWLHQFSKYMNNYDYNRTLLMLNKVPHLANEFLSITENAAIASPISVLNYEFYKDETSLAEHLKENADKIQCIVSGEPERWITSSSVAFGQSQHPELWDYADGADTVKFLLTL